MNRLFLTTALALLLFPPPSRAKLGENLPELIKRFGSNYTVSNVPSGASYHFRMSRFSVDCILTGGFSTCETYYSYTALRQGEPPRDIVQGILKTNVPQAKWREILAPPFGADYALRSEDTQFIATLHYRGMQPENAIWTITVQKARPATAAEIATAGTKAPAQFATALPAVPPAPTPPRLSAAERAKLGTAFRATVAEVLAQVEADGTLTEPAAWEEIKEPSPAAGEAITTLPDKVEKLREELGDEGREDNRSALELIAGLTTLQKSTRDLKSANAPAASAALGAVHQGTPISSATDGEKSLWRCLDALHRLCTRLQSQAKPHLDRARSAADAGQNGTATSEYQEAYKIYPDPEVARTIKRLREESLGL